MEKMILRLKIFYLFNRTITLLFATLLITIGTQLAPRADASQFLLSEDTLKDSGSLAVKLQDTRAVISQHIAPQLSAETRQLLGKYDGISSPSPELQRALILDMNKILQAGPLYDAESFAKIELSEQTAELLAQNPEKWRSIVASQPPSFVRCLPARGRLRPQKNRLKIAKGIEKCRENLRQIQLALEKYRDDTNADMDPQWLSDLSPEYLKQEMLLWSGGYNSRRTGCLN